MPERDRQARSKLFKYLSGKTHFHASGYLRTRKHESWYQIIWSQAEMDGIQTLWDIVFFRHTPRSTGLQYTISKNFSVPWILREGKFPDGSKGPTSCTE